MTVEHPNEIETQRHRFSWITRPSKKPKPSPSSLNFDYIESASSFAAKMNQACELARNRLGAPDETTPWQCDRLRTSSKDHGSWKCISLQFFDCGLTLVSIIVQVVGDQVIKITLPVLDVKQSVFSSVSSTRIAREAEDFFRIIRALLIILRKGLGKACFE